jgi:membrane protease YdiL (CAAX protease family)
MSSTIYATWKVSTTKAFVLSIFFAFVLAGMRAIGNLGPLNLRPLLPLGFVLMAITPWILLTAQGRREIGLQRSSSKIIYLQAILYGTAASMICFLLGLALFGSSTDNWFVSIAANFGQTAPPKMSVLQLYLMFTVISMIFSPIGEEIFFRGVLQRALQERFSVRLSTCLECIGFGLVHLCHHGIVLSAAGFGFLPKSAPIWFLLMTITALLFAWIRKQSTSLYPAMAAHMAFNFSMGTCIFMFLWPLS